MTLSSMPDSVSPATPRLTRGRPRRFQVVTKVKAAGATYTPTLLAAFVASQIISSAKLSTSKEPLRVVDPACGDGQLLLCLLERLESTGRKDVEVFGFD